MLPFPLRFWIQNDDNRVEDDSWGYIIVVGILIPLVALVYGSICIARRVAEIPCTTYGNLRLLGFDAVLAGLTLVFAALALHCGTCLGRIRFIWRLATPATLLFGAMALVCFVWCGLRMLR